MISYPSFILFQHPILHQVLCPRMCLAYGVPSPTGWGCRREGDEKDPAPDPAVFLLTWEGPMSLQLIRFYAKGFRKTQISYILLNLLMFVVFIQQVRANIVREIYSVLWGKLTSIWQSVDLQISIPPGSLRASFAHPSCILMLAPTRSIWLTWSYWKIRAIAWNITSKYSITCPTAT